FEQLKDQLPDSKTMDKVLTFKNTETIYSNVPKEEKEETKQIESNDGMTIQMKFDTPEEIFYYNSEGQEAIQQRSFMGRTFLVEGNKTFKWKITGDTKEILGYSCTKATTGDSTQIVAWFTSTIPVFSGPDVYNGLPGLILEVDIDEGKRQILATNVVTGPVDGPVVAPSKGKKVTTEQYEKIMKKKIEEMQQEFEGKGNFLFITSDQ
ncbi:MAG: GLPGLI family protein, partial [Bacteroidota bacterium]